MEWRLYNFFKLGRYPLVAFLRGLPISPKARRSIVRSAAGRAPTNKSPLLTAFSIGRVTDAQRVLSQNFGEASIASRN